jgi:hypothetical protein
LASDHHPERCERHSHSTTTALRLFHRRFHPQSTPERSTTKGSSLIAIGAECLSARTSERSPIVPNTRFTGRLSHIVLGFHLRFLPESTLESARPPNVPRSLASVRAPACSRIGKIAYHSRRPFHEALIRRRLVLPSPILPVVGARVLNHQRCLASVQSSCLLEHRKDLPSFQTPISSGAYLVLPRSALRRSTR